MYRKRGFTIVEIVVAMAILLIAFGLVTVLYTRSSQIRRIISNQNEVQLVLTQMINAITYADRTHNWRALQSATIIYRYPSSGPWQNYALVFKDGTNDYAQYYLMAPGLEDGTKPDTASGTGTDTTLWHAESTVGTTPTKWYPLELNKNVYLQPGARFEFVNANNEILNGQTTADTEVTAVKVTFIGKSADPSMRDKVPVTVQTMVRARNKTSF